MCTSVVESVEEDTDVATIVVAFKSSEQLLHDNTDDDKLGWEKLSLCRKILFGMAAPPLQMSANVVGFFMGIFLLEVVHLDPLHVSLISFVGRAFDAITDPIAGQLVSKTETRIGRSKPWMLVSCPLGAVAFFLMWCTWDSMENSEMRFIYYMCMYLLYCALITGYHVPYTSSTMTIANNAKDKDGATACRMAFEIFGTILGAGLFGFIINTKRIAASCSSIENKSSIIINETMTTTPSPESISDEKWAYKLGALVIALIYLLCGIIGLLGIKERYPCPHASHHKSTFWHNIKAVLTFRPYLLLMMAFLFISLGVQIVQVNLALYSTHSVNLGKYMSYGIMCVLFVAIICIPFWNKMTQLFGKKRIYMIGIAIEIPCLILAMLAPKDNYFVYFGIASFSGIAISVAMLLPWSMLPDVIDDYYVKHGVRREATFYSLYVFFNKFAVGFSIAASQFVLFLANYNSKECTQPESVGLAMRYLIGPAPIGCFLLGIICLWFYPITKEYREKLTQNLFKKQLEMTKNNNSFKNSDLMEANS